MKRVVAYLALIAGAVAAGAFLDYVLPQITEERNFRATMPADHYNIALRFLKPGLPRRADRWERALHNNLPTRDDVKDAIRHLEAIPDSAPEYKPANELLPYLRALLDRPKDYEAMVQARWESCEQEIRAPLEAENKAAGRCLHGVRFPDPKTGECRVLFCGNDIWESCKPLNDLPTLLSPVMIDLPQPTR